MEHTKSYSKKLLWTGRIISYLCIIFLLVDAIMKIIKAKPAVDGTILLGLPLSGLSLIGFTLLIFTILYIIPRSAIIGAILLSAYLGGAVGVTARAGVPGHPYLFPVIFCVLVWIGLYLQNGKLRLLLFSK